MKDEQYSSFNFFKESYIVTAGVPVATGGGGDAYYSL